MEYSLGNIFNLVGNDDVAGPLFQSVVFYKSFLSFHYIMLAYIALAVIIQVLLTQYLRYAHLSESVSDADR